MDALSARLMSEGYLKQPLSTNPAVALPELAGAFAQAIQRQTLTTQRQTSLSYDLDRALKESKRARDWSMSQEREKVQLLNKSKQLQDKLAAERAKHAGTLSDFQKSKLTIQFVKSVAEQERKRKERELTDIIAKLVKDAEKGVRNGDVQIKQVLASSTKSEDGQVSLLQDALRDLEHVRESLVKENGELRHIISNVNQNFDALLKVHTDGKLLTVTPIEAVTNAHPDPSELSKTTQSKLDGFCAEMNAIQANLNQTQADLSAMEARAVAHQAALAAEREENRACAHEKEQELAKAQEEIVTLQNELQQILRTGQEEQKLEAKRLRKEKKAIEKERDLLKENAEVIKRELEQLTKAKNDIKLLEKGDASFDKVVPETIGAAAPATCLDETVNTLRHASEVQKPVNLPTEAPQANKLATLLFNSPTLADLPRSVSMPLQSSNRHVLSKNRANIAAGRHDKKAEVAKVEGLRKVSAGRARFLQAVAKIESQS